MNIHELTMMVRGFSNEVTVNWLASELGISYSTLARCKNGVWPRSVTFDAMKGVFDACRERFFADDGAALVESALGYLERDGIEASALRAEFERGGYEAFVTALLAQARDAGAAGAARVERGERAEAGDDAREGVAFAESGGVREGLLPDDAVSGVGTDVKDGSSKVAGSKGAGASSGFIVALPVVVILFIGLVNVSLADAFAWVCDHMVVACVGLLVLAISPVVLGALVDAPLAWTAYAKAHPGARLTLRDFALVSKYGGTAGIVPGAGRFDLSVQHCVYQAGCNLLGALCSMSLFGFLVTLPGFAEFFATHEWTEFFKVGVAVGFFVAFSHNAEIRALQVSSGIGDGRENPDTYLPTRIHVWANTAHLVVTFSVVCILTLGLLAYSFANFRAGGAPLLILWPFAQTIAFLGFSSLSRLAEKVEARGVGAFAPGVAASSVGVAALVLVCYLPSWEGAVICGVCALCLAVALAWLARERAGERAAWLAQGRKSGAYSLAVVSSVFLMLAIGLATSVLA